MSGIQIDEEAYDLVRGKKNEIYDKYKKRIDMMLIASIAIKHGMNKVDGELGLNKIEQNLKLVEE